MRLRSYFRKRDLFIIGCGRSGTAFTTHVFKQLGLDIGHETIGRNGMVSWMGTVHQKKELRKGYKIILHQVREPLDVISSIMTFNQHSWNYIYKHVPQISMQEDKILQCAKYWYHWNVIAEKKTKLRYRVENINEILPFICHLIRIEPNNSLFLNKSTINSRRSEYNKITWEEIKNVSPEYYEKCRCLSEKYGY